MHATPLARALAFAYDVELRLDPWYGRPRTSPSNGLHIAETASDSNTSVSTIRYDKDGPEAADLLACGCILSELCAGEPVLAGPTASERTSGSGGGGRADWLEAAVELPPALRSAIGALTHADPSQVSIAVALRKG